MMGRSEGPSKVGNHSRKMPALGHIDPIVFNGLFNQIDREAKQPF
jgi:hypothetical protein